MIIKEFYTIRTDGIKLYRTYSNNNKYIRQVETGVIYSDAIDVESAEYTYEETEDIIENSEYTESAEEI
jgi:hypothetical protein